MELTEPGSLLRKEDSGERHFLLVFFLKESGLTYILARRPTKASAGDILPDLFDTGIVSLQRKDAAKPSFLKEFEPLVRHTGIARSYACLKAAASLSQFFERNLLHMETFDRAWEVLAQSLDALSCKPRPEVVVFKALFLIARSEGYAVSSSWLNHLPTEIRPAVQQALKSPLEDIEDSPAMVEDWTRQLYRFFERDTDLLPPD